MDELKSLRERQALAKLRTETLERSMRIVKVWPDAFRHKGKVTFGGTTNKQSGESTTAWFRREYDGRKYYLSPKELKYFKPEAEISSTYKPDKI